MDAVLCGFDALSERASERRISFPGLKSEADVQTENRLFGEMKEKMYEQLAMASLSLFGTEDYESALAVLPAYDGAVKEFKRQEKLICAKFGKGKDEK